MEENDTGDGSNLISSILIADRLSIRYSIPMQTPANISDFAAPWGRLLKLSTLFICFIGLGAIGINFMVFRDRPGIFALVSIAPLGIAVGALFAIRGYSLTPTSLIIKRPGWKTEIPLADLQTATIDPEAMTGSVRLMGNGGVFVISGLFRNQQLGNYRAFVTDLNRSVVLRLKDRTLVISPDSPEAFVQALRARGLLPIMPQSLSHS